MSQKMSIRKMMGHKGFQWIDIQLLFNFRLSAFLLVQFLLVFWLSYRILYRKMIIRNFDIRYYTHVVDDNLNDNFEWQFNKDET